MSTGLILELMTQGGAKFKSTRLCFQGQSIKRWKSSHLLINFTSSKKIKARPQRVELSTKLFHKDKEKIVNDIYFDLTKE